MTQSEEGCGFAFTAHDRRRLAAALAQAQDVKFFRRLQVVLYLAEGGSVDTAAHFARVDRSTVHRWLQLYQRNRRPEELLDEARPGGPAKPRIWMPICWPRCWPKTRARSVIGRLVGPHRC
jgi:Winged helix-turn helix